MFHKFNEVELGYYKELLDRRRKELVHDEELLQGLISLVYNQRKNVADLTKVIEDGGIHL